MVIKDGNWAKFSVFFMGISAIGALIALPSFYYNYRPLIRTSIVRVPSPQDFNTSSLEGNKVSMLLKISNIGKTVAKNVGVYNDKIVIDVFKKDEKPWPMEVG